MALDSHAVRGISEKIHSTRTTIAQTGVGYHKQLENRAPILSLILCTYNRTSELDALFQSLTRQTYVDFEVIVVDQNADDRIQPSLKRAKAAGLLIRHIRHGVPNLSTARNIGIQVASGEWIGFPDDDCWYEPDLLEQLSTSFVCTEPLAGCAACWDESSEPGELPLEITWERSRLFRDRIMVSFMLFFNRKLFDRIGYFDPRLGVGQWFGAGEETDLVMRALHAGASIRVYPNAKVHHPMKEYGSLAEVRRRARGAGALYVKHDLPLQVIVRGLIAPVLRPLLKGRGPKELLIGCMYVLGRWEGWRGWKKMDLPLQEATIPVGTNHQVDDRLHLQKQKGFFGLVDFIDFLLQDSKDNSLKIRCFLILFRLASYFDHRKRNPLYRAFYYPANAVYCLFADLFVGGAELPAGTRVGRNLTIHHGYGMVIGKGARLQDNIVLRQGVTIGNYVDRYGRVIGDPVVEAGVEFGAGACALGSFTIGKGAFVGANSVVFRDVGTGERVYPGTARHVKDPRDDALAA